MKKLLIKTAFGVFLFSAFLLGPVQAQELNPIQLNAPDKTRGLPLMEAISVRASARDFLEKDVSLQDLSDLLWAANGINRPDGKRTASSAMNAQDVDIFVFTKDGAYLYDAKAGVLNPIVAGDYREQIGMRPGGPGGPPPGPPGQKPEGPPMPKPGEGPGGGKPTPAPILLVLVSNASRFERGTPELKYEWGAIDCGIVSQNISLFCAATGLATRPRAGMDKDKIRTLLKLKNDQHIFLNHPVGFRK